MVLINMRGGKGAADWEITDFGSARLGVTYALADQRSTIGYVSPYSSQDTQASFRQRGSAPDLIFDPDRATDTSAMLTLRDGDHINGWHLDATGYDNALLLDQTGDYYVTDTVISNAEESGTLIDGQTGTTPVLHVSNSTLNNNTLGGSTNGAGLRAFLGGQIFAENVTLDHNIGELSQGNGAQIEIGHSSATTTLMVCRQ